MKHAENRKILKIRTGLPSDTRKGLQKNGIYQYNYVFNQLEHLG